jgi:hypothetical protein
MAEGAVHWLEARMPLRPSPSAIVLQHPGIQLSRYEVWEQVMGHSICHQHVRRL